MRAFGDCLVLVLFATILVGTSGNPIDDESIVTLVAAGQPLSLLDVETQQGHENEGDRLARHHGYGGWGGGHPRGYGHGGGYHGHRGGHRGGYYG
ncbi:neuropeptide-like protein 32 [Zeugodacus cucurbitae]|uniref:neuropeptide-like protein 32 n=1 Tax=Zeugodacus cucurbitae TaxID=28588 RepID=UPI0023D92E66|nr:neuropeptide-like protein 32 [Zeugodacus cucurbitae]